MVKRRGKVESRRRDPSAARAAGPLAWPGPFGLLQLAGCSGDNRNATTSDPLFGGPAPRPKYGAALPTSATGTAVAAAPPAKAPGAVPPLPGPAVSTSTAALAPRKVPTFDPSR